MPDFAEALNVKMEDIKEPPKLPIGTYRAVVNKVPEISKSDDGKWTFVDFNLKIVGAQEDVDQDELRDFGGLANTNRRHRFLFPTGDDEDAKKSFARTDWAMKQFMEKHLQANVAGMSKKEALAQCVNHECLVAINRRADKENPEIQHENIKRTAPVE